MRREHAAERIARKGKHVQSCHAKLHSADNHNTAAQERSLQDENEEPEFESEEEQEYIVEARRNQSAVCRSHDYVHPLVN